MFRQIIYILIFFFPLISLAQSHGERLKSENSVVFLRNEQNFLPVAKLDTIIFSYQAIGSDDEVFLKSLQRYANFDNPVEKSNLLVLSIFDSELFDYSKFQNLEKNIILCIFDENGRILKNKKILSKFLAVVEVKNADSLSKDYCGQYIFGGLSKNSEQLRFKYTVPSELQLDSTYIFSKIDSIINYAINNKAFPGCQVFVAVNQKVIVNKSYGFHTYDSLVPVTNSDLYDIASVTKISTAAPALMKLQQAGKIDIYKPFSHYWKPFKHSNKKNILWIDILCHQGQLKPWIPFWKQTLDDNKSLSNKIYSPIFSKKYSEPVADNLFIRKKYKNIIYKRIKNTTLLDEKQYKYSDLSFYLYPPLIEKITKQNFEDYLYDNFYHKLGAYSLCFNPIRQYDLAEIVPTENDMLFRKQLLHGYVHDEGAALCGGVSAHAGLFANANDLAKLIQMFLNYGEYGGVRYIDSSVVHKWTDYQFADSGNRRGIVFDKPLLVNKHRGTPASKASDSSFGHSGFTGTFVWADPENGLLFIFLSNRVYPNRANKNLLKLNIRTNIHDVLYSAILNVYE